LTKPIIDETNYQSASNKDKFANGPNHDTRAHHSSETLDNSTDSATRDLVSTRADAQGGDSGSDHRAAQAPTQPSAVLAAIITSTVASWTNLFGKGFVEMLKAQEFYSAVTWILLACLSASGLLQLMCMRFQMQTFEAVVIIPIYQCLFILSLILEGSVYFEEFSNVSWPSLGLFGFGLCLCILGISILSRSNSPASEQSEQSDASLIRSQRKDPVYGSFQTNSSSDGQEDRRAFELRS